MRILILDTSTAYSVVGTADEEAVCVRLAIPAERKRARDLVPSLKLAAERTGWRLRDVELILVGVGPGSYTGLRVGLMAAKTLAMVAGATIAAVDSLAAAALTAGESGRIAVAADAQSQRVYSAKYSVTPAGAVEPIGVTQLQPGADWLASLTPDVFVTGPGLALWETRLPAEVKRVPPERRTPSVDAVYRFGMQAFAAGRTVDLHDLEPQYLRPSAAEEKRSA